MILHLNLHRQFEFPQSTVKIFFNYVFEYNIIVYLFLYFNDYYYINEYNLSVK